VLEPRLFEQASFSLMGAVGAPTVVEISAVLVPVSKTRASIMFVDNRSRTVYGQVYVDNYDQEGRGRQLAADVMAAMRAAYERDAATARARQKSLPPATETLRTLKAVVDSKVRDVQPGS
jgi:spermidine synthase